MNEIFNFKGQEVRTVTMNNEPLFLGNDIANILGYKRPGDAIKQHVDSDDKRTLTYKAFGDLERSLWQGNDFSNKTFITESGVYALIFGSELPQAKEFKRWVTSEVLPTIRKHGIYAVDDLLDNPDMAIAAFQRLKEERQLRLQAQEEVAQKNQIISEMKPKATYYDLILQSDSLVAITVITKDYGKSARWLNTLLHELKVQYRQGNTWLLYQQYADRGYTQSKTHTIDAERSKMHTYWTQKGRLFIYDLLKNKKGILPKIEQEDVA
ncbi:TPA: phage antirepressor [Streptococcus agalactiae]|mgnify:CR=1 FL=1|jgi:prophage antirepressor-like protein|uniref:Phage antirepressor n=1 Tax=Streptococcus agalactiae TaxID=1311 RepID=A0A853P2B4_STRAG|nr:phage antirepressor KilAC domain-containing protein [Streptococcus agalactiae]EMA8746785.1 phage antirepressor KilAC domain-containing protein [Streptococcus agalactiae]EPW78497.1 BRO-like protein [Streptococcus agalactiae BSU133]KXA51418.1 BRO family protein [Streptococcus agalactiae]MCH9605548.1 phage antirepressor KilAC domain-containing protein [Streptococcus agalactiae]MDK7876236.1 phage antirepressor KilAC domain-containing protein [Streptococcus agalactiae]